MKIRDTLYFDHQATTPVDPRVLSEMLPYFSESFGNPHSSDHSLGWESAQAVEHAAARVARLIGAAPDEIIFTSGATEANNLALLGLTRRSPGGSRCRILLSAVEHKSVLAVGRVLEQQYGYSVERIPVDPEGFVIIPALEEALDDDVLAVSVMAVNNEIGTIQDIQGIAARTRDCGAVFHCDAVQAPVALDMTSFATNTDMLSLSSHKLYGPKGIGALYISRELQESIEPLVYGGGQQNGIRSGTVPTPLCVGMGAAAKLLASQAIKQQRLALRRRRDAFVAGLSKLGWAVSVNGPKSHMRHPGNANVCFPGLSAHDILGVLQPRLAASTGSACTSGLPEPSHVLKAAGLDSDAVDSSIRFSLGFDTSDGDVQEAVSLIEEALEKLSKAELSRLV